MPYVRYLPDRYIYAIPPGTAGMNAEWGGFSIAKTTPSITNLPYERLAFAQDRLFLSCLFQLFLKFFRIGFDLLPDGFDRFLQNSSDLLLDVRSSNYHEPSGAGV